MAIVNFEDFSVVISIPMDCPSVLEGDIPIDAADYYFSAKISNPLNHLWKAQLEKAKLLYSLGCSFGSVQSIKPAAYSVHKLEFTIGKFKNISQLSTFVKSVKKSLNNNINN